LDQRRRLCARPKAKNTCGEWPAPALDNKICFSGVTDHSTIPCVFRIDIEDHSEPGNIHAIAAAKKNSPSPDRYRIRMWFIGSGATDARFNGAPGSANILALRDAVACHDALDERVNPTLPCVGGATPCPNIDDGGEFEQR